MSAIRRPHRARLVLAALLALAAVGSASGACSLNPQPIPPGAEPDAAFGPGEGTDPNDKGNTADASFADGAGGGSDASTSDVGATPNTDAGDAGDASDAADAIADAADGG